jgi:hypothetical protein
MSDTFWTDANLQQKIRVVRATAALAAYQETLESPIEAPEKIDAYMMIDVLTDLQHLSDSSGIDFEACLDRAIAHYDSERAFLLEGKAADEKESLTSSRT